VQSSIEVISACIVVWRFKKVAKPGEERDVTLGVRELRLELIATWSIGILLVLLALATYIASVIALVLHQQPDSTTSTLVVAASSLVLMVLIWLPKRYLARALDSSAMKGEATCSLSCIQITVVLFIGALVHRLWRGGWWIDSATSLVLGTLFAWEGYKLIRWARNPDFNGGCCGSCAVTGPKTEDVTSFDDVGCCSAEKKCSKVEPERGCHADGKADVNKDSCCRSFVADECRVVGTITEQEPYNYCCKPGAACNKEIGLANIQTTPIDSPCVRESGEHSSKITCCAPASIEATRDSSPTRNLQTVVPGISHV